MTKELGRPHKENPRNKNLTLRLTLAELSQITTTAQMLGISKTDAIVRAVNLLFEQEFVNPQREKLKQSTWADTYIDSKLDYLREYLEENAKALIEKSVSYELEKAELMEQERIEKEVEMGRLSLHGAAYDKHMKKFSQDMERELYDYFKSMADKDIEKQLEEERKKLETE